MSDENFDVVTRIVVDPKGSAPGIAAVQRQISELNRQVEGIGSNITRTLRLAVGVLGASAVFSAGKGIVSTIVGINTAAQNAEMGIAGLFAAMSGTSVPAQLGNARGVFAQLRADAAAGAGETQDYVDAYQRILGPARAAGASLEQIRELTRLGLGAGFALRGDAGLKVAGMDIVQGLLGGLSPAESQVLAPLLGISGSSLQALNKAGPEEKVKIILKALQAMDPAVKAMGATWDAQFSTLKDNAKQLIASASAPIFARWLEHLTAANQWMVANRDLMFEYAETFGRRAVDVWDQILERAREVAKLGVAGGALGLVGRSGLAGAAGTAIGGAGLGGAAAAAGVLGTLAVAGLAVNSTFQAHPQLWSRISLHGQELGTAIVGLGTSLKTLSPLIAPGSPLRSFFDTWGTSLALMADGLLVVGKYSAYAADGVIRIGGALTRLATEWLPGAIPGEGKGDTAFQRKEDRERAKRSSDGLWDSIWRDALGPKVTTEIRRAPIYGPERSFLQTFGSAFKKVEVGKPPPFKPTVNVTVYVEQATDPYRVAIAMKDVFANAAKWQTAARKQLEAR